MEHAAAGGTPLSLDITKVSLHLPKPSVSTTIRFVAVLRVRRVQPTREIPIALALNATSHSSSHPMSGRVASGSFIAPYCLLRPRPTVLTWQRRGFTSKRSHVSRDFLLRRDFWCLCGWELLDMTLRSMDEGRVRVFMRVDPEGVAVN